MPGASGRHSEADALDRAWDDLVRGEGGTPSELGGIVRELGAAIPAPVSGARERVWRRLALTQPVARSAGRTKLRIALIPQPAQIASPRRWFSSPMLALEGIIACLLIVVLAFAITTYRSADAPQRTSQQPIRGGQSDNVTLNLYPSADVRPVQVAVFEVTIDPASTWFGLDGSAVRQPIGMAATVLSGELYTDSQERLEPFRAGESSGPATFLRNNDPEKPLVVRLVLLQLTTDKALVSTRDTRVTPIFAAPVERPEAGVMREISVASGTYTGQPGQVFDHLTSLDGDAVRVISGSLEVEALGAIPATTGHAGESTAGGQELSTGARVRLDAGDWVAFTGVDRAPKFRFVDRNPVTLLTVQSRNVPLQRAYVTTQPQQVVWTGVETQGDGGIILRQLTAQPDSLLQYDYTGLTFFRVISGSVTIQIDGDVPLMLTAQETYSAAVSKQLWIKNSGNQEAVLIQGSVFAGSDVEGAWGLDPQSKGIVRQRLAIVPMTIPAGRLDVSFGGLDGQSIEGSTGGAGVDLLVNMGAPISIQSQIGDVSIGANDEANIESIEPDTLTRLANGTFAELGSGGILLATAGSAYSRSATSDTGVLAYTVSIRSSPDTMAGYSPKSATPQPQPTMDPWHLRDLLDQATPAMAAWTGELPVGKVYLGLSEVVFPVGTGFTNDVAPQPAIYLLVVVRGEVTVTVDDQATQTFVAGESASFLVSESLDVRNSSVEEAFIIQGTGWPGYVPAAASSTPVAATPVPGYYAYFLANAVVDLSADRVTLTLEVADETTVPRSIVGEGYTLIETMGGPMSLQVTAGTVGIRDDQPTRDEYLQGTGFTPVAPDTTLVMGYITALAEPGAAYTLSASPGDQVLTIFLSITAAD
jgi:hypothetical protein